MTKQEHDFKRIESYGDAVVRLAATEVAHKEYPEDRYAANDLIALLVSNETLRRIAIRKGIEPHKHDPGRGSKMLSNAYEYSIGYLRLEKGVEAALNQVKAGFLLHIK